ERAAGIKPVHAVAPAVKAAGAKKQSKGIISKNPPGGTRRHEPSAKRGRGVAKAKGAKAAAKPKPAKSVSAKKK
ncbi:hypothetical protein KY363_08280, partial [Candidatus Woesearchaeota archaeon]|nr:hypothetical protein [Candidatus Woesearchaeota archaeon]